MKAGLTFAGFLKIRGQVCEMIRMCISWKKIESYILWLRNYIGEVEAIDLLPTLHCRYGASSLEVVWSVNGHFQRADVALEQFYEGSTYFGNLFCR